MRPWFNRKDHSGGSAPTPPAADGSAAQPLWEEESPRSGDSACCCPAYPVVRVVMPPTPQRPHPTDLLLCGHHHRVSREALAAAGAVVHKLPGTLGDAAAGRPGTAESSRPQQSAR
jgi:hypothetical protein